MIESPLSLPNTIFSGYFQILKTKLFFSLMLVCLHWQPAKRFLMSSLYSTAKASEIASDGFFAYPFSLSCCSCSMLSLQEHWTPLWGSCWRTEPHVAEIKSDSAAESVCPEVIHSRYVISSNSITKYLFWS